MAVRRLYCEGPRLIQAMLPPLVAFVMVALLAPVYSSEETDLGLTLWQAVVTWPIGAAFLFVPASLLVNVTDRRLFRAVWLFCGGPQQPGERRNVRALERYGFGVQSMVSLRR
jgi:hypothetical protein